MKNTLVLAAILALVHFGCGGDDGESTDGAAAGIPGLTGGTIAAGSGGSIVTGTGGAAGMTTAGTSGSGPVVGATGGTEATAGSGGETNDALCPSGIVEEDILAASTEQLAIASGCTTVKGSVTIVGEEIDNIDALSSVTTIEGSLVIQETSVSSLLPLSNLTSVGKDLNIFKLVNLTTLEGLGALTTVVGAVTISEHEKLVDLHGLTNFTSMGAGETLNLKKNPSLPTCEAKWLIEKLGRTMDTGDATVEVCSTVADACGSTAVCDPDT